MKVGILGTRGIPNTYGGFEQFAEQFAVRMQERGHDMLVYNSSLHPYQEKSYKGVKIRHCYDPEDKLGTFGQFIYDLNAIRDARKRDFDILLMLGYTSSSIWMPLVPKSTKSISNMDGMEWMRSKYSARVQAFLKKAEKWAALKSDALIADSLAVQQYLQDTYQQKAFYAAYGAELFEDPNKEAIREFGVQPEQYGLLIARSEPENNVHIICEAYQNSQVDQPLLVVGKFENAYGLDLQRRFSSGRIRFIGPEYDLIKLNNLRYFSRWYFHGHSVGGTNPSLLEAMASSCLIFAHQNPFNQAVLEDHAFYFRSSAELEKQLSQSPDKADHRDRIEANRKKIKEEYSWDQICDRLEKFFKEVLAS